MRFFDIIIHFILCFIYLSDVGLQTSTFPLIIGAQSSVLRASGSIVAGPDFYSFEGALDEVCKTDTLPTRIMGR